MLLVSPARRTSVALEISEPRSSDDIRVATSKMSESETLASANSISTSGLSADPRKKPVDLGPVVATPLEPTSLALRNPHTAPHDAPRLALPRILSMSRFRPALRGI